MRRDDAVKLHESSLFLMHCNNAVMSDKIIPLNNMVGRKQKQFMCGDDARMSDEEHGYRFDAAKTIHDVCCDDAA